MDILNLTQSISFPECDQNRKAMLIRPLRDITLTLRDEYYKVSPVRDDVYTVPFGGSITDSIGPWPEFILRGLPCQKSKKGCCTPCFYSRMPQVNKLDNEIYDSLILQTEYIIQNFKNLVIKNQMGPVASLNDKLVGMVLTPVGSFFDPIEFPPDIRNQILELLVNFARQNNINLAIYIETHAEHIITASENQSEFNHTIELLRQLKARIIFGFESINDFVRNILYNKHLALETFENAISIAKTTKLGVGAFVFVGINPLTEIEIISDAIKTID